ncbi:hypothetical protein F2Q69_00018917, partial [Brassica cretica]
GSRKMESCYYLVFIFSIIHIVQAQQGFISLDCGLPTNDSPYIEPVTGLVFSSDADHIQSGKSGRIQKDLETLHIKPYLFLRYFPDGMRNCYTLDVLQNIKYLIKAVFVYGNYDGFSDSPSFDLYLGPNKWARVDLEGKVNGTVEEVIHVPRSNSLQICLVKTGNSLPFVSALELRMLRNDTYVVPDVSLKKLFRRYYRQSDRLIRYPDDVFDRIWSPFFLPEWKQITTTLDVNNSNNFEPPKAALKSAATPKDNDQPRLTINWTLDNPTEQVHLYFHFAELQPSETNSRNLSMEEAATAKLLYTRRFIKLVHAKEVELLLRVHHTNLVSLVGYCDEQTHLALIYEYMSNGDLKAHLSGKYGECVLNWANRLRIAVEVALGLEYLHSGCKPPMVHRDVKSVNILLDEHLQAKLADFGLSRSFSIGDETHVSTGVVGTPGYLDPEYYRTHRLTEKSDVYSFGIVLLEMITNQPVIDQVNKYPHIAERVGTMLTRGDIKTIVDPDLNEESDSGSLWKALELAMSCVNPSPVARPDMSHVVHELKECVKSENLRAGLSQVMESNSSVDQDMSSDSGMTPNAR